MFETIWIVKIIISLIWYLLLPGAISSFLLFSKEKIHIHLAFSFAFGFCILTFFVEIAYFFRLELSLLNILISSFNTIVLIFYLKRKLFRKVFTVTLDFSSLIILIISILGFYFSINSGWHIRGDSTIHIQAIRNILTSNIVSHPVYSMINSPIIPDHVYDSYYYLLALISKSSNLKISIIWHYLTPIFSFILPIVVFTFVKSLTVKKELIIFSLISFFTISIFYNNIMYGTVYDALVYPNRIYLWFLLPVSLTLFFFFLEFQNKKFLVLSILIAFSQIFIHQSGFIFYLLLLGGYFALSVFFKKKDYKASLIAIISLPIISLPFLILKLQYNFSYIKGASADVWHKKYGFVYLSDTFYSFDIFRHTSFLLVLFSIVSIVVILVFSIKTGLNKRFVLLLSSSFLVPVFIIYNPFIVPFLGKIISFVAIGRMLRIPLYFLLCGIMIFLLFKGLNKYLKINSNRLFKSIVVLWLLVISLNIFFNTQYKGFRHELSEIALLSNKYLKGGSILISDLQTSTDVVTFMDVKSVAIQFNGAVDLIDISNERKDITKLMIALKQKETIISHSVYMNVLKDYNIDYVILNKNKFKSTINIDSLIYSNYNLKLLFENKNYLIIENEN